MDGYRLFRKNGLGKQGGDLPFMCKSRRCTELCWGWMMDQMRASGLGLEGQSMWAMWWVSAVDHLISKKSISYWPQGLVILEDIPYQ